ncbi:MAG: Ig-like domain-containing protein, partial [Clostridia bacterium]|nr:Ig-like domain-containing protein [Clostridia bacterium]
DAPEKLYIGQRYQLKARVYPETATNQKIKWYTSDSSILLVDTEGNVVARKAGTAEIRIQSESGGHIASCVITVTNKISVTGITIDTTEISLGKGAEHLVISTIYPANASEKGVQWFSSNLSVASVDENGLIKAVGAGQAVITARTVDGSFVAKCKVIIVQPVLGVQFSADDLKIAKGTTGLLTASVIPVNATNKELIWFSSDSKVATVDQNGLVKALESGTAEITATSVDGGYSATCRVNVYVAVSGVSISSASITVPKGEKRTVTAVIKPANAANTDLIWSSSNESVATVNGSGVISGKAKGTATITVQTEDGGFKDTCTVEVVQLVTAISLESTSISLDAGKTKTLVATVSPASASNKNVTWKSSDKKIAKVSSKGVVTAVKAGTAVITVQSKNGNVSTTCRVTVTQPATGISLNKKSAYCDVGGKYTLKATLKPANVTSNYVTWTSSNTKVATVTSKGVVKGLKTGTTTITAATANGTYKATCKITVIKAVTSVALDKSTLSINVGKTSTLTPTVKPSSASIKTVSWSSSDNDIATVSPTGVVTAKAPGYATITVTTKDNEKTDTCRVLVIQPVSSVKLNKTSATMEMGDTYNLKATVKPSNASNQAVKWSTSDKKVATVDANGKVTAVGKGTATITVKTADGNKTATFKVTVIKSVTGVSISESSAFLYIGKTLTLKATVKPSSASNKNVKWYSSNEKIAKVSQSGVVTPLREGTVKITVKTVDGGFKKTCTVEIEQPATSVKLNKTAVTLDNGKSYTLKATISPADTTDKSLKWYTSDDEVVTVTQKGVIKAVGKGTATITVKTSNGLKASCKVTVKQPVTSIKMSHTSVTVYMGDTFKISASARPTNANDRKLTIKVGNSKIIDLKSGVITPKAVGKTTITVSTSNGVTAKCTVTVKQHVESVKLNKTSLTLVRGKTYTLVPTVNPSTANEKGVTFTSSDENVVTVSSKGVITAVKGGTATITVKSKENNKTASCKVTVREPVTGVSLSKSEATMFVSSKLTLKATIAPEDAYNKKLTWSTSDKAVATVSSSGVVVATGSGKAVITVKTADGGFTAKCEITVNRKAEKVELNEKSIVINKGEAFTLVENVLPYDCYNKNVTWSSSDEKVAVVNNGTVSGINTGKAVITVKTEDGGFTAQCEVQVNEPVGSVKLSKNEITLHNGETDTLTATVFPENADNKNVTWSSSDEKVATVKDGKVTGIGKGTAVITVKTEDGEFVDVCSVTVLQNVTEISVKNTEYTIKEGTIIKVDAFAMPENAENRALTWQSSDESVATVNNGEIKGVKKGEAEITISSVYTKGVSTKIKVIVTKPVAGITISKTLAETNVGGKVMLEATVTPADANNQKLIWTSSDEKIATVADGVVTAKSRGEVVITVSTVDGGYTANCRINVVQPVTHIKLDSDAYYLYKGEPVTIKYEVFPANANNKTLTWSSSDENILTVVDGVITPLNPGTAEITVTDSTGVIKVKATATVVSKVTGVEISKEEVTLKMGQTEALTATVKPEDATNKNITWTSSDEAVAIIKNGVITPVGAGTAIITVTTEDGKFMANCLVTVTE